MSVKAPDNARQFCIVAGQGRQTVDHALGARHPTRHARQFCVVAGQGRQTPDQTRQTPSTPDNGRLLVSGCRVLKINKPRELKIMDDIDAALDSGDLVIEVEICEVASR